MFSLPMNLVDTKMLADWASQQELFVLFKQRRSKVLSMFIGNSASAANAYTQEKGTKNTWFQYVSILDPQCKIQNSRCTQVQYFVFNLWSLHMFGKEVVAHLYRADALGHVISFSIYLDCATHHLVPCETGGPSVVWCDGFISQQFYLKW